MEDMPSLGIILRTVREARGISARALSLAAGLSESYVGKVESGAVHPSLRAAAKIMRHLELKPSEIAMIVTLESARPGGEKCSTAGNSAGMRR